MPPSGFLFHCLRWLFLTHRSPESSRHQSPSLLLILFFRTLSQVCFFCKSSLDSLSLPPAPLGSLLFTAGRPEYCKADLHFASPPPSVICLSFHSLCGSASVRVPSVFLREPNRHLCPYPLCLVVHRDTFVLETPAVVLTAPFSCLDSWRSVHCILWLLFLCPSRSTQ